MKDPSDNGSIGVYGAAGGKVVIPKTAIGPHGFFAQFIDTEGNKLALHSMR